MPLTVAELTTRLGATLEGEGTGVLDGMSALDEAGPSDISFLSNPRYAAALAASGAGAVLVNADWSGESPCPVIRVPRADVAFMQVSAWLGPPFSQTSLVCSSIM